MWNGQRLVCTVERKSLRTSFKPRTPSRRLLRLRRANRTADGEIETSSRTRAHFAKRPRATGGSTGGPQHVPNIDTSVVISQ